MKNFTFFFLFSFIFGVSFSQETHYVNAGSFYYSPSDLTINQGDIVVWINDGGFHDVNGDINTITGESFNNPEAFDSDAMNTVGGEIYTHTFNVPGFYNYDCSVGQHASMGMVGSITVNEQGCEDDNSFIEANFGDFFINDCSSLIDFLYSSYGYSAFESCAWNGAPMSDFGGLTIGDICECSCEGVEEETTTVVDIIVGSDDHNTLETAVITAGLVDVLSGEGPFTVFAPTDAAFDALPEGTLDAVLADMDLLTSILTHHVASGSVMSTDLSDGMMLTTLNGTELTVLVDENGVMIDNAMVTVADIEADNGVVHVIDAVLIPEDGCEDDDTVIAGAFQSLSTCAETISFLMTNYGYSESDACAWDGDMGSGSLFGGMTMFDFCECSCENVPFPVFINELVVNEKEIEMIVDLLGRKVEFVDFNKPYFIIYNDGTVSKSMVIKQ